MNVLRPTLVPALFAAVLMAAPQAAKPDSHDTAGAEESGTAATEAAPERDIVIGGGSVAGVYFPAAGAICRVVTQQTPGRRCLVESNSNSSANLERLTGGLLDFAVVQSDWLMHASRGTSLFRPDGPDETLRAVLSLHAEALTLVARAGAGIDKPQDLAGKRLNLGPAYTYQRVLTDALLRAIDLDEDDLAQVMEVSTAEQFTALCTGELDAAAVVAAHPSPVLADAMQRCDLRLVPITGKAVETLIENRRELAPAIVTGGLYVGTPDDIPTFGLRAVLATTTQVEEEIVEAVVKAVLDALPTLTVQHPALARLDRGTMATAGIALPLHAGAQRAFKAAGVLP
ncbi:MAG: TAXI family TRAP transporter solute-binding subunit [Alphaproteobacteria bacterium]|nr:TAXI family TRAP transporter solute-binding subunit [Alphaproteobacteria bacterium]